MKKIITVFVLSVLAFSAFAQVDEFTAAKRARRQNLTVKEWNTDSKTKTRWLDHVTTYDAEGRKVEEIEYAQYGQKWRETYEYGENDKIIREIQYDDRDKPVAIRKYEYNSEGRKIRQYNYGPNGKLLTTKVFEYISTAE